MKLKFYTNKSFQIKVAFSGKKQKTKKKNLSIAYLKIPKKLSLVVFLEFLTVTSLMNE